jgi:NAD(P)H-flavin reductase
VLKFWENHPFSLGAWAPALEGKSECASTAMDQNKLIFYVRPYDGWTRRLRDQCREANGVLHPNLLIEGPYGHTEAMHHFDTNLMIVGGTGIAAAVPYLLSHLERVKRRQTKTSRIHVVWSIRQREMWNQVFTADLLQLLQSSDITITIYCSKLATTLQDLSPAETDASKETVSTTTATPPSSPTRSGGVRFMPGRPNVQELLMAEVEDSKASTSSIGVFTCGPAQMADECRSSVYEVMKHGFHAIDYFEEAFGW